MKQKLIALLLCGTMLLAAGCGSSDTSESADASESADSEEEVLVEAVDKPEYNALDYVVLGDYMGLEIESTLYTASENEYEETILSLLEANAYYEASDKTTVEDGDLVNIDYVGTIDGVEFDGGSDEDAQLEIGSDTFIDGFEDQLIGVMVGETVNVEVTFPDEYSYNEDLEGQDAVFVVTVNYIYNPEEVIPEYDDDFVYEITSGEYTTVEEYDAMIWEYLEESAAENTQTELEANIEEAVFDICEITDIPDGLVDYYVYVYYTQDATYASYYGMEFEDFIYYVYSYESVDDYLADLEETILSGLIPVYLIQEAIIEAEGLEVTEEGQDNFMVSYAAYYGYDDVETFITAYGCETVSEFISYVGEDSFEEAVLNYMVWDMIEEAAIITYVEDGGSE